MSRPTSATETKLMQLRPARVLILLLLFSAALPAPRMLNFLIAEAPRQGTGGGRKVQQVRGRNRIGSPVRPEACCSTARMAGGDARRQPPMRFMARRDEPAPLKIRRPSTSPPIHSADLRLRC